VANFDGVGQLFGREDIVAAIESRLAAEATMGLLLTGPAGIGKTRIAEHVLDGRAAVGVPVWRIVAGGSFSDLPLGAIAASLPPDLATSGLGLTLAMKKMFAERAEATLVLVDDADALDDSTVEALVNSAESGLARLVLTQRSGTILSERFAAAVRQGSIERLECGPLDARATIAYAEHLAGDSLTPGSQDRIVKVTGGNPLYIRELVASVSEAGLLDPVGADWSVEAIPSVADRLTGLLRERLDALAPEAFRALTMIAAAEPSSPGELRDVSPDTIEELRAHGLVTVELDQRRAVIRMAHPLHGEIVRAMHSPLALRSIRADVAESLSELGARRRHDGLRLATWSLDGGREVGSAVLLDASRFAFLASDYRLAERLARVVFERAFTFAAGRILEPALYELGDPQELETFYEQWEPTVSTPVERAAFEKSRAAGRYWRGRRGDAVDHLHDVAQQQDDLALREELLAQTASMFVTQGRIDEAIELGVPLLDSTPGVAQIHATLAAGHGLRAAGRPEQAVAVLDAVVAAYRAAGPDAFIMPFSVLSNLQTHALTEAGRFEAAEQSATDGIAAGRDAGSPTAMGLAHLARGWSAVLRGRVTQSEESTNEARRWLSQARHPSMVRWAVIAQGLGRLQAGDLDGGRRSRRELEQIGGHPAHIFESNLHRIDARIAYLEGRSSTAFDELRGAAARARALGNVVGALGCWHDAARLGWASDVIDDVEEIAGVGLEGPFLQGQVAHVRALADGGVDELAACADVLEAAGLENLAAEVADEAARITGARGDSRSSAQWVARAAALRSLVGPMASPVDLDAGALLTRREREVAMLAGRGMPSREIADRLSISTRTVDNHLGRAYRKLGVGNRAELAALLNAAPSATHG